MIHVIQGDITKVSGFDAIVNPANNSLLGGGGLNGLIHRAAGPQLKTECRRLNGCETGDSKLTLGYDLPCKYVIHSVGPVWMGGTAGEEKLLGSCYASAMQTALDNNIRKIAFSSISTGEYGYPLDKAAKLAIATVSAFVAEYPDSFDDISFVLSDDLSFNAYSEEVKNVVVKKPEEKKKPAKKTKSKAKTSKAAEEDTKDASSEEAVNEDVIASTDAASTEPKEEEAEIEMPTDIPVPPIFQSAPYNRYHIDWLIDEVANGTPHTYTCFWLAEKNSDFCQLSPWYQGEPIYINGRKYLTAIQYISSEKALLFNDFNSYKKIMNESDPAVCQRLGDSIKNYDDSVWKNSYREILFNANVGKFLSDKKFADALLSTDDTVLIHANPNDDIYGAGITKEELLTENGALKTPPQNWHMEDSDFQAKNELGFVLMAVRDLFS